MNILRLTIGLLCLSAFCGCSKIEQNAEYTCKESSPSFVIHGKLAGCDCVPIGERFAKAELGLDPTERENIWQTPDELLALLKSKSEKIGNKIIVRNVNECLDELASRPEAGPADMTLLIHSNGHLYLLLGTVMIGDVLTYQIIHGDSSVWLIDKKTLEMASFANAWQFVKEAKTTPIQVGNTILELSPYYFNFGKVLPAENIETVITLKNKGTKHLLFKAPETSCVCTVTDIQIDSALQPNQSRDFKVHFQTSAGSSERHQVVLPVYEKETGLSKKIEFLFLASQQQSMQIEPLKIDFGRVVPREKYTRTVNFSEVPTDRFSIVKFDSNKKPFKGSWETIGNNQGLNTYQVSVEFEPDEQTPYRNGDYFIVETNSIIRPKVQIPCSYELIPDISTEPNAVSLGSIKAGDIHEKYIKIISRKQEKVSCEIRQKPDCCTVEISRQRDSVGLLVRSRPEIPGIWQDKIVIAVKTPSREDVLEINCIGYVH